MGSERWQGKITGSRRGSKEDKDEDADRREPWGCAEAMRRDAGETLTDADVVKGSSV
jgi:hypothetical protein